ncbi:hypothetical protein F751_5720 [Auxenochlorella protothecoides]|uniref:Uncharacterized protein n=1 Tax=Auxenochlorella protothecoides TaxID=3075 RepID=A0A087SRY9_AUXPR|nr:hypothetical protein F751_5720 [Auxenochlorella protothecoides]KFM28493.1 hypothetical protein F751_5720 [Auxenochlorella protothecoides]
MVKPKVIPGDVDTLAQYSPEGCLEREARITAALETLAHPLIVFDRDAAFEAMSWALYKTRKFASNLRKLSLETMAAHPDMYARFLGADFPAYLA